ASSFADVVSHRDPTGKRRGLAILNGDAREMAEKRREAPGDVFIEPQYARTAAVYTPARALAMTPEDATTPAAGIGATLELMVVGQSGRSVSADLTVVISNLASGRAIPVAA